MSDSQLHTPPDDARLLETVAQLMGRVFGVPAAGITPATTPDDVPRWDSLAMLTVLIGLERRLGIALPPEAAQVRSVAELLGLLAGRV